MWPEVCRQKKDIIIRGEKCRRLGVLPQCVQWHGRLERIRCLRIIIIIYILLLLIHQVLSTDVRIKKITHIVNSFDPNYNFLRSYLGPSKITCDW